MADYRISRREFIQVASAGTAMLTIPSLFYGCSRVVRPDEVLSESLFMDWYGIDEALISRVMSVLTSRGADDADIYFEHNRSNSFSYEDGIVSQARTAVDHGVGLRVVVGDQTGYAFTEDLTPQSITEAASTAIAIAHGSPITPNASFQVGTFGNYYQLAVPWSQVAVEQKLPRIEHLAASVMARDPTVQSVIIEWADEERQILLADMHGRLITDNRPMTKIWCTVSATKNGETLSNSANIAARAGIDWYSDERIEKLAREAVDRTLILFDSQRPPAGEMPVVLAAGASGILLHEAIGHGMEADFNRKEISIYSDMLGQRVAPEFVTIVDDGTQPNERGSINFDGEGANSQCTVLVENGILASYLHDSISARHYGVESTGSGRRQSFRHSPMPRMRSTYMLNGPHTRDEIITSVQNGILAETFTNGQVEIGAGDFTFYIKNGWLIEDGRLTAPIKDCNIIGNGPEVLRNVTMVADDSTLDSRGWTCGKNGQSVPVSLGLPTVLISQATVGGDNA